MSMSEQSKKLAPLVRGLDFDAARDIVDQSTDGELDCFQLDLLTDLTMKFSEKVSA